jgi:hypothetical protein
MNGATEITLELDQLETRGLALCWGLASSYAKDGSLLFSRLSNCFEREYAIRTGKSSTLEHLPAENTFDFGNIRSRNCGRCTLISHVYPRHFKTMVKDHRPNSATQ